MIYTLLWPLVDGNRNRSFDLSEMDFSGSSDQFFDQTHVICMQVGNEEIRLVQVHVELL